MSTATTWASPIFFDLDKVETIAEEEASITLDYTPPVILPDDVKLDSNQILEVNEPLPVVQSPTRRVMSQLPKTTSSWLWLVGSLGMLLGLMLLVDTYHFIVQQYDSSLVIGTLFFALIVVISVAALILSWQAYQQIRVLRTVSALQQEGQELMEANGYGKALPYLNKIAPFYNDDAEIRSRIERFYLALNDSHHDRDVYFLFSSYVMKDIDQQAYSIVTRRSKETALLVMISQIAFLDTVLTLWRNVRMIRDIATLYGGRPGFLGSIGLIGIVLQNLIYADVSEVVADSTAEIVGGSMLSVMSAQIAQGLGSGVLTARLGLHAIEACRALPFGEDEKPRLKDIRREIMSSLKGAFDSKEKGQSPLSP